MFLSTGGGATQEAARVGPIRALLLPVQEPREQLPGLLQCLLVTILDTRHYCSFYNVQCHFQFISHIAVINKLLNLRAAI